MIKKTVQLCLRRQNVKNVLVYDQMIDKENR